VIALLRRDPEVAVSEGVLGVGDFSIAPGLLIERKTAFDFSASIIDRRLFDQIAAAKESGTRVILLIEGDPYKQKRLHANAITGAISYISVIEGFPVVQVPTIAHTCEFIKRAAKHARDGLGYEISMRAALPKSIEAQQLFLLEGLPGVGRTRARDLLRWFGSVRRIFAASPDQIGAVPGLGESTASKITELLDTLAPDHDPALDGGA
jgi:ERCC4-type nuclease